MSDLARIAPTRALDGASSFTAGARFVVLRPKSWRLAIVPVLVAMVTISAASALGVWGALRAADAIAELLGGAPGGVASILLRVLLGALALLVGVLAGMTLAQPLSGPALDALAREHEIALGGPVRADGPFLASALRSLRVTLTGLALGVPILGALALADLFFPPVMIVTIPLKVAVMSMLVAWDLLDYPFSLRQMRVRDRVAWIRANLGAVWLFGLGAAVMLFVPGVGLLLLPIGVAGATHLVVRTERALLPADRSAP